MWCCASKPEVKKPLKSARQQPMQKVQLNLPPYIRLQFKKKWEGKIEAKDTEIIEQKQKIQKKGKDLNKINELRQKIEQLQQKKQELENNINREQVKGKQLETKIQKAQAISTVLQYMILKQQQNIDSYAYKIKS